MRRLLLTFTVLAATAGAFAQQLEPDARATGAAPAAATRSATTRKAVDRSNPRAVLAAYIDAQRSVNAAEVKELIAVTDSVKQPYVDLVLNWMLWSHYLERAAVRKFGVDEGRTVLGNQRTAEEHFDLDARRLKDATVEYSPDRTTATLFMKVEPDRPAGLQTDRFSFLDRYVLIKAADGWRIDFLQTYDCADPQKEPLYHFEAGVYPLIATAMKELSEKLAAGEITSAAELKKELDARTEASYSGQKKK
jgi:hypothetical protein